MLRVSINGLGRIGRAVFRINQQKRFFDVVAINDVNPSNENLAYLLKYDSTYGRMNQKVKASEMGIHIEDHEPIPIFHKERVNQVRWEDYGVDVIIDASGVYDNLKSAREVQVQGVKKIIVTHSPDAVDRSVILGVNDEDLSRTEDFIISSSICDANAFAPVINLLHNAYGVSHGFLTTLHPWLGYQNLVDGPCRSFAYPGSIYENFTLGRASLNALIPKTTSCIKASAKVLGFLNGSFQAISYRVPTSIVSSADISVKLGKQTDRESIIELFERAAAKQPKKIFYNVLSLRYLIYK